VSVAFDAVSPDTSSNGNVSSLTSASWTVAGADRLLLGAMAAGAGSVAAHNAMKWGGSGGTGLTQVGSSVNVGANGRLSAWRLTAPAAAAQTLYAEWAAAQDETMAGGTSYTGADQTTPIGTPATATGTATGSGATNMTVVVPTAVGDVVWAVFFVLDGNGNSPLLTPNGTPTPTGRYEIEGATLGFEAIQIQEVVATGTSTTVSCAVQPTSGSLAADWGAIAFVVNAAAAGATADQEGARFGNDDGSESAHTFAAAQDAGLTAPLAQNVIVRALVDGTGDLPSTAYALRYQKNGTGGYLPVPVGSGVSEAYGTVTFGAAGTAANGSTSVAPTYPAGITAGQYLVAVVTSGATNSETPTPADGTWTQLATGASTDGTFGIDTGPRRVTVFGKEATGSETGTSTFNLTNGSTARGQIYRFTKAGSGAWAVSAQGGNDSTSGTGFSATLASMNWNTGDATLVAVGQRVDSATQSSQSLAASGVTFGTRTNRETTAVTTGNDHRCVVDTFAAVTGTSNVDAAPTWSYTASASVSGGVVVVRLREYTAPVTNELYVSPSANIAAGGEATTARLAAPAGKTTSDFVAGRRWDDENGADSVDVTADDYTELEWCLQAQSPASNGDFFDLRVYAGSSPLASYGVTPRWTIGASDDGRPPQGPARRAAVNPRAGAPLATFRLRGMPAVLRLAALTAALAEAAAGDDSSSAAVVRAAGLSEASSAADVAAVVAQVAAAIAEAASGADAAQALLAAVAAVAEAASGSDSLNGGSLAAAALAEAAAGSDSSAVAALAAAALAEAAAGSDSGSSAVAAVAALAEAASGADSPSASAARVASVDEAASASDSASGATGLSSGDLAEAASGSEQASASLAAVAALAEAASGSDAPSALAQAAGALAEAASVSDAANGGSLAAAALSDAAAGADAWSATFSIPADVAEPAAAADALQAVLSAAAAVVEAAGADDLASASAAFSAALSAAAAAVDSVSFGAVSTGLSEAASASDFWDFIAEARTYFVLAEDRTLLVEAATRVFTVPPGSRSA
jgi:hypothetical protein